MKKLTAGILASLIGLVSANSAEAAVASTKYVNDGLATKQDTLTPTNFVAPTEAGDFITGFTVDKGTVTFTSGKLPAAAVVDATLSETSTNAIQNQAVAKKIAEMALTTDGQSGVIKTVKQTAGKVEVTSGTVAEADIADNAVTSAKIADSAVTSAKIANGTIVDDDIANDAVTSAKIANGTIVDDDIANVAMGKVTGLDTALNAKQDTLTQAANAGEGITIENGKIAADITQTEFDTALGTKQNTLTQAANAGDGITISADGKIAADITQTEFDDALGTKQNTLTQAANAGEGITISADGKISADVTTAEFETKQDKLTAGKFINIDQQTGTITTTYSAGTGIKIDETTGAISADNQLDGVDKTGEGLQVLTRDCSTGTCQYVWEEIDRTFGN